MRTQVPSLAPLSGLRIQHCCELWCSRRHGSDLVLLWLWSRPAATALIQPLAWEPPYATVAALKRQKPKPKQNKTKQKKATMNHTSECLKYRTLNIPRIDKTVEELELSFTADGKVNGTLNLKNILTVSLKVRIHTHYVT